MRGYSPIIRGPRRCSSSTATVGGGRICCRAPFDTLFDYVGERRWAPAMLQCELINHQELGVEPAVFMQFFVVLRDVVRGELGEAWTQDVYGRDGITYLVSWMRWWPGKAYSSAPPPRPSPFYASRGGREQKAGSPSPHRVLHAVEWGGLGGRCRDISPSPIQQRHTDPPIPRIEPVGRVEWVGVGYSLDAPKPVHRYPSIGEYPAASHQRARSIMSSCLPPRWHKARRRYGRAPSVYWASLPPPARQCAAVAARRG